MLDLNAAVRGLVPPECIKSGVVDDDDAAPVGRLAETSAKTQTRSWLSQAQFTLASITFGVAY